MVLCLAVMLVMVFGNVVLRLFFNTGIDLSEEIPRFAFVWMTFLGAVVGMRTFDCPAATDCRLFGADVDGDGVDELLVGSIAADGGRHADVLRFFP